MYNNIIENNIIFGVLDIYILFHLSLAQGLGLGEWCMLTFHEGLARPVSHKVMSPQNLPCIMFSFLSLFVRVQFIPPIHSCNQLLVPSQS